MASGLKKESSCQYLHTEEALIRGNPCSTGSKFFSRLGLGKHAEERILLGCTRCPLIKVSCPRERGHAIIICFASRWGCTLKFSQSLTTSIYPYSSSTKVHSGIRVGPPRPTSRPRGNIGSSLTILGYNPPKGCRGGCYPRSRVLH